MKKGQAALEFLMTYGWALLVVLVMIGALAYFGVLTPGKIPKNCEELRPPSYERLPKDMNYNEHYIQYENNKIPFNEWQYQEDIFYFAENDNAYFIIPKPRQRILLCTPETQS